MIVAFVVTIVSFMVLFVLVTKYIEYRKTKLPWKKWLIQSANEIRYNKYKQ